MRYVVRTYRTETTDYELEASSPEDAEERFLMDGDEIDSDTTDSGVEEVLLASDYHAHRRGFVPEPEHHEQERRHA